MQAGLKLKRTRERLGLRYREVEQASATIAQRRESQDFVVGLSRLADIENKGVVPTLQRLYSLCSIYRLDVNEVLEWYGLSADKMMEDADVASPEQTHPVRFSSKTVTLPLKLEPGFDLRQTSPLGQLIRQWGSVPLALLDDLDLETYRYAVIGTEDYLMYPLLQPGALIQIDESARQVTKSDWSDEFDRPIYFLELRDRYACSWCDRSGDHLILQPHPRSPSQPIVLDYKTDVDVLGRVIGIATKLDLGEAAVKPKARTAAGENGPTAGATPAKGKAAAMRQAAGQR